MLETTKPKLDAKTQDATALLKADHKLVATLFADYETPIQKARKNS